MIYPNGSFFLTVFCFKSTFFAFTSKAMLAWETTCCLLDTNVAHLALEVVVKVGHVDVGGIVVLGIVLAASLYRCQFMAPFTHS